MEISVKELKSNLSKYLKEVRQGKIIKITRYRRLVAKLCPAVENKTGIEALISKGLILWKEGKPKGAQIKPKIRGKTVAEYVLEDRQ
jgi:antitoxin (DNA-binding transcriptional repressor) of toxin-antitoxin stability system